MSFLCPFLQIGYSTVFFWEYFGPLMAYALIYALPNIVYPGYKCVSQSLALRNPLQMFQACGQAIPQSTVVCAGVAVGSPLQEFMSITLLCRHIPKKHPVQTMALAYWSFHYAKRIFETFVVHRCDETALCPIICAKVVSCGRNKPTIQMSLFALLRISSSCVRSFREVMGLSKVRAQTIHFHEL